MVTKAEFDAAAEAIKAVTSVRARCDANTLSM
jgi:hypothetical protein